MSRTFSRTRRTLSQNFLVDAGAAQLIVRSSGVRRDDLIVEIGPGDGMLTRRLVSAGRRVLAYEKDPHYVRLLARRYADDNRIRLYHSDIRDVAPPRQPFAVVANVPFALTTDIVRWCLEARHLTSATLVTQLEFARKHSGDYGRWSKLTVTHWPWTAMALGPRVDRVKFHPRPRVDAAVLHLNRRAAPLLPRTAAPEYRRLVELGFSGVGGSLAASLRRHYPAGAVRQACARAGVGLDLPVGYVSPDAWVDLFRALSRV
ncbi:23S ribosomal RNA methyltransferase Erm [Nocardia transvalensis]|uniref:23S ribosomal RNA methyltransferase Erm n=1 Tax=Nocardia transvalensis TaxID=37333 RepID=UPI00189626AD|nr:23S ribosomal RNA methyltransferase Erm [Nocardia transvalensis]MBF6333708.1 23S ribosomal RNA methyltransferase Erm [Nocardia transvalensis]